MPELRIILLVVGVLFVAAIAGFEWWRSRGQRPATVLGSARVGRQDEDEEPTHEAPRVAERSGDRHEHKPLPEINVVRDPHMSVQDALPVIELASASDTGTRRALGISISDEVAVDLSRSDPYIGPGDDVSEARVVPEPPVVGAPQLTLSWPAEGERRIVTLRVMPRTEPRFAGRALRQAFSGCGFWHGPLDIYHLPDEQGRVLLSAAALAQPGTFDPSIMDSQRFSGLNLFAVLPGAAPEREIFEELVHSARQLAERLDGVLQDQHGGELTPERIARLRQSLEAAAATPATRASGQG
jgi:cell division protein ZipA